MGIGTVAAALVLGFLAGVLAFKTKSRWCPRCGTLTFVALPECHGGETSKLPPAS
ncbi:hypothetical protein [Actinoplanes sp. NPDC089786]|uniref:hypothetical protein n=1 Tax=Actinoplanes sp. NPDC089786 TaxID=3155185 RepID=UPI00342F8711